MTPADAFNFMRQVAVDYASSLQPAAREATVLRADEAMKVLGAIVQREIGAKVVDEAQP
jgi:hypothetical protein